MQRGFVGPEINQPDKRAPLIIARDPGADEVERGIPLIGASGRLLFGGYDPLLNRHQGGAVAQAGLTRKDFNITNRVLRRPWNNEFHRHSWEDIEDGKRHLFELIEELKPSIIIATGNEAAYDLVPGWDTLTDRRPGVYSGGRSIKSAKGIVDRRGFLWYPEDHLLPCACPVLVTLHPAACLYQPMPNRLLLDIDFQRAGAVLRGELPRREWPDYTRIRVASDLAPLWDADLTAFDVEVKWGGAGFLCIAFYTSGGQAFLAYADGFEACREWLEGNSPKLAHNGQFDRYYLQRRMGVKVGGRQEDTIVGHWACYPELAGKEATGREDQKKKTKSTMTRKGLNFLASFHLNVPWWKSYTTDIDKMGELCVNDVAATMWLWEIIKPEIQEMGVEWQYNRQISKLPALIKIQERGMLIDNVMRKSRLKELRQREEVLYFESRKAAQDYLYDHDIKHREDGSAYWWYKDAQCKCCGGGKVKSQHCPECANLVGTGADGAIKHVDILEWVVRKQGGHGVDELRKKKKAELMDMVPRCIVCKGSGKIPRWDFNPMSNVQLPEILWNHLGVPKYTYSGTPDASEETIRRVLEWTRE